MDGTEVPHRLKNSPIKDYEQITALLRDGRGHEGMDFRKPMGTQTVGPKAGTVVQPIGTTSYNGNCLEGSILRWRAGQMASHGRSVGQARSKIAAGSVVEWARKHWSLLHLTCTISSIRASVCLIQSSITTPPSQPERSEYMPSFLAQCTVPTHYGRARRHRRVVTA